MQTFLKGKRVGYWLSEKKIKKLNFQAFAELCRYGGTGLRRPGTPGLSPVQPQRLFWEVRAKRKGAVRGDTESE